MAVNTSPIHGKYAKVTDSSGNLIGYSTDWSLTISNAVSDASRQGQDWEEKDAGQNKFSGSMNFLYVMGNTEQKALHDNIIKATGPSVAYAVRFYVDSTQYYSGSIVISSININTTKSDNVKHSVSFEGTGAIAYN